jgi:hypothetical protein
MMPKFLIGVILLASASAVMAQNSIKLAPNFRIGPPAIIPCRGEDLSVRHVNDDAALEVLDLVERNAADDAVAQRLDFDPGFDDGFDEDAVAGAEGARVDLMDPPFRQVVQLRYDRDTTIENISRKVGKSSGAVKVSDFGLARELSEAEEDSLEAGRALLSKAVSTCTGSLLGTPAYMSPEQLAGKVADARSDQFSFIRNGVPGIAFIYGYENGSKEIGDCPSTIAPRFPVSANRP